MDKLAARIGAKGKQVIFNWQTRGVPAEYCPLIERETGVRCEALRPDIAWGVLRRVT